MDGEDARPPLRRCESCHRHALLLARAGPEERPLCPLCAADAGRGLGATRPACSVEGCAREPVFLAVMGGSDLGPVGLCSDHLDQVEDMVVAIFRFDGGTPDGSCLLGLHEDGGIVLSRG